MKQIKIIPKKDLAKFVDLGADAYPGMGINTAVERKSVKEKLAKRYDCKGTHFYGAYDDDKLKAGIILYDYEMNLFGHKVPAGGGGFLAVDLLHKKEHLARDLCRFFMKLYRKQNCPFALLWPFRPDFYRKMGAGMSGKTSIYRFKPSQLPQGGSKKHLRNLKLTDKKKVIDCFNRFAQTHNGMVYDFEDYRKFHFVPGGKTRFVGFERDGKLDGFMSFTFEKGKNPHFLDHELHIHELIYNEPDVLREFISYLSSQFDQVPLIQLTTYNDHFQFAMIDPRNDSGMLHAPVFHESNIQAVGIMYRLINSKLLFTILKDHSFSNETVRVKLNIKDSFLKENNKPVAVYFENGFPTIKASTSKVDVTLDIDIADFSSLVMGSVSLKSLNNYGLIKLSNSKYLDQLNNLFKTEQKPLCLTHF